MLSVAALLHFSSDHKIGGFNHVGGIESTSQKNSDLLVTRRVHFCKKIRQEREERKRREEEKGREWEESRDEYEREKRG